MGFFTDEEKNRSSKTVGSIPRCGACGLRRGCQTPNMELCGQGRRGILVVGEAPGKADDIAGRPFVGESGELLRKELKSAGIDLFRDCWITNAVTCRPPDNRDPTADELKGCLPNLVKAIRDTKPEVVLCLGRFAIGQVIGQLWDAGIGTGNRWLGFQIPSIDWNAWVCSAWHPAFIKNKLKGDGVERVLWKKQLQAVGDLEGMPWPEGPPNYDVMVRRCYEPLAAADAIRRFIEQGEPVAFDYETDRLKPDHPDARIVSCSVSDGGTAWSFPWVGKAVEAMRELLWSAVPKMGWNIKFEERWTRRAFGRGVRNWLWDGMQAAHVQDNRKEITSLKFQAFVRLGLGSYDTRVSPYLRADSSNERNRIKEIDLGDLLQYGGLDALCTALVCKQQMKEMGAWKASQPT